MRWTDILSCLTVPNTLNQRSLNQMKRISIIASSALLIALAACSTNTTTAPGAVSGTKSDCCATSKAACCKDSKSAAACDAKAKTDAAAPGAVSGQKKSGCGTACPSSGGAAGCPMTGKTNG